MTRRTDVLATALFRRYGSVEDGEYRARESWEADAEWLLAQLDAGTKDVRTAAQHLCDLFPPQDPADTTPRGEAIEALRVALREEAG